MELVITGSPAAVSGPVIEPRGGTELMRDRVLALVPQELRDKVQLVISQKPAVFEDKPRILWVHDLPKQPGPESALAGDGHEDYNVIVFVSYWQREQFSLAYPELPLDKCLVIKNGIEPFYGIKEIESLFDVKADAPFKLVYSSTPHRGLEIVPLVLAELDKRNFTNYEFHIYSSFALYGQPQSDARFAKLFDTLKAHPNVRYHGTVDNETLRESLRTSHMFVYPSVYQETSCLAAIEAMAAGCAGIMPGLAALPETCGEWGFLYPWVAHSGHLAHHSADFITQIAKVWSTQTFRAHILMQASYYNNFYNIQRRSGPWKTLFETVAQEPIPEPA